MTNEWQACRFHTMAIIRDIAFMTQSCHTITNHDIIPYIDVFFIAKN